MPQPLVEDPLVGKTVGGYVVEYQLGEGAMGLVYRALHPLLNRHFAIKVLKPEVAADKLSSSNFVREAQTLSKLKHPSIIDIVGFGPLGDGRQYMVMEYVVGRTLERELLEEGRLESDRALMLSDEILDALSAAHSVEVIHRDLKPSNVFLAKVSGGREVVKLLDFGLARQHPGRVDPQVGGAAAESGIAGTPEYIAPEQAIGEAASRQSDLYSFGVMLFRMLTGALPFKVDFHLPDDQQVLAMMKQHVRQAPPTIIEAAPEVQFPEGLSELVAELLKKSPDERPSSAEAVRKRLRRIYAGLQQEVTQQKPNPLLAAPESSPKPARRRRLFVGGSLGLTLALAAGWAWWGFGPATTLVPLGVASAEVVLPTVVKGVEAEAVDPPVVVAEVDLLTPLTPMKVKHPMLMPVPATPCDPDAEWKHRARADLSELATRASGANAELTLWAADRERPLSLAIDAASNDADCRAVSRQLATFKQKVTGP